MSARAWLLAGLLATVPSAVAQDRAALAEANVRPALEQALAAQRLRWGAPMLVRIFKHEGELEVWLHDGARYRNFRTYPICTYSGTLGPKRRQGDRQAPEGFYFVGPAQLNPRSTYHLSFDLGYPNAYDRAHRRTGDFLMVHGNCVSIGCYAMGDAQIEQIYTLLAAALRNGQRQVPVHAFPFRFDAPPRPDWRAGEWGSFWGELEPAYHAVERTGIAPAVRVVDGHYRVDAQVAAPEGAATR
jgi:murein L,D-transpeptidase YafK